MASDGKPAGTAVHATGVSIAGRGLLLLGPSKSGKSSLAAALIARSSPGVPIFLIGDDRILLQPSGDVTMARAHPRIAGFIERRGLGLVASPFVEAAPVAAIVCLGSTMPHPAVLNFPTIWIVNDGRGGAMVDPAMANQATADHVLAWVLDRSEAAAGTQGVAKDDGGATLAPKD